MMARLKGYADNILKYQEGIYSVAFLVALLSMLISQTIFTSAYCYGERAANFYNILKILRYGTYLVFLALIGLQVLTGRVRRVLTILVLAAAFAAYRAAGDFQIASYFIIAAAAGFAEKGRLIKISAGLVAFVLAAQVLLSTSGLIENYVFSPGTRDRQSLGFVWTTVAPTLWFSLMSALCILRKGKFLLCEYAVAVIVTALLYDTTDSRYFFLMELVLILMIFVADKGGRFIAAFLRLKPVRILFAALPFILAAAAYLSCVLFDEGNALAVKLDNLMSNRLILGKKALEIYGVRLFGSRIEWKGSSIGNEHFWGDYFYVDSSYLNILLNYGIIILFIVLLCYSLLIWRETGEGRVWTAVVIAATLLLSLSEPRLINVMYSQIILYFGEFLRAKNRKEDKER